MQHLYVNIKGVHSVTNVSLCDISVHGEFVPPAKSYNTVNPRSSEPESSLTHTSTILDQVGKWNSCFLRTCGYGMSSHLPLSYLSTWTLLFW